MSQILNSDKKGYFEEGSTVEDDRPVSSHVDAGVVWGPEDPFSYQPVSPARLDQNYFTFFISHPVEFFCRPPYYCMQLLQLASTYLVLLLLPHWLNINCQLKRNLIASSRVFFLSAGNQPYRKFSILNLLFPPIDVSELNNICRKAQKFGLFSVRKLRIIDGNKASKQLKLNVSCVFILCWCINPVR